MDRIDFTELRAEDVLNPNFISTYKERMEYFWPQLIRLNNNLYVVEQILYFPFKLFVDSIQEVPFFLLVRENFLDMSVLIINRLLNDDTERGYTLRAFKNKVMENALPLYKAELAQRTSLIDLKKLKEILKKVREIRNDRIAHAKDDFAFSLDPKDQLAITDIMILRDRINELFDILSFSEHWGKTYPCYDPNNSSAADADIVKVMDNLAFTSPLISLPEREPEYWLIRRNSLTEADIKLIKHYRWKLGWSQI